MDLKFFEYLTELRSGVIHIISGSKNSNSYLGWDATTPNWATRYQIEQLIEKHIGLAKARGLYVVTRYSNCSNPKHEPYPTEDRYGLAIRYRDERFIWNGKQLFQGSRSSKYPCARGNFRGMNSVIDDFVYEPDANIDQCDQIADVLAEIHMSLHYIGSNQPRSGAREILLRAVLRINDSILPMSVDEYIAQVRAGFA